MHRHDSSRCADGAPFDLFLGGDSAGATVALSLALSALQHTGEATGSSSHAPRRADAVFVFSAWRFGGMTESREEFSWVFVTSGG